MKYGEIAVRSESKRGEILAVSGIYGIVGPGAGDTSDIDRMSLALAHRGPDDESRYVSENIAIGCRRLSIQDIEHGRQPLSNDDESIWIVLNGEIYNCEQLRTFLTDDGCQFRTNNDAEVILRLYESKGVDCIQKLRGMFAFAIWDDRLQQLILARDHLGQKPLFFSNTDRGFLFASETKGLIAARPELRKCDYTSLFHYLSLRFIPSPGTMLRNVWKIPPAHYLVYKAGEWDMTQYWTPSFKNKLEMSDHDFIDGLEEKFHETVSSHLVGERQIGAFLSGGLDSSLIVAAMAEAGNDSFPTFSVGTKDAEFDELPYARMVSERFGTRQFETLAETDLIRSIVQIVWHLDEPSDPVSASKFLASKLAAQEVKVVLGGDGGDELFAGFDRYRGVQLINKYARLPAFVRDGLIGRAAQLIPATFGYDSISQKIGWVNRVASVDGVENRFAEAISFFRFNHDEKRELFTPHIWDELKSINSNALVASTLMDADANEPIEKMLYTDYVLRLPEHSLMLTDRLSMAHGLEVRSPLVDKELVEYVASFPLRMKIRRGQSKYAERQLARRCLPVAISKRAKRGFRFPLARWFGNELFQFISDFFADSQLVSDNILNAEYIGQLLDEHQRQYVDHHVKLWMLLNLEIWYRLTIKGEDHEELSHSLEYLLKQSN